MRTVVAVLGLLVGGAVGVPAAAQPASSFEKVPLSADELAFVAGMDIFKFKVEIPADANFRLALQEQDHPEDPPRVLHQFTFQKTGDEPALLLVSFLRRDGNLGRFLLGDTLFGHYRVQCHNATPGGIAAVVPLPLPAVPANMKTLMVSNSSDENERWKAGRMVLARVLAHQPGTAPNPATSYPRVELLIELVDANVPAPPAVPGN